jgi:catechol 2,3-dioxygenase-like lactoylglutathione lyase family enzyme
MRLEHVNLTVRDLDRAVAFYTDLLDLRVRWKGPIGDGRRGAHVGDDEAYIALFEAGRDGEVPFDYSAPGFNHLGFVVDDLDEVLRRLDDMGVAVHLDMTYEPGRHVYCFDPEGHEVELVAY